MLGDFALAKASGALDDVDEDEELEGEEGVDWVWWRADDTASPPPADSATTYAFRPAAGSATRQAALNDQGSADQQQQQQQGQGQAGPSGSRGSPPTPTLTTPARKRPTRTSVYKSQSGERQPSTGEPSQ